MTVKYLYVESQTYGKDRRKFIKEWFNENPDGMYCVNTKYRPQVKNDSDLKKLIRSGFLKILRIHQTSSHAKTFLVKA